MAFRIIYGDAPDGDLKMDYKCAEKFGNLRIGRLAVYFPSFPVADYIPLSALTGAWVRKRTLPVKGCCGGHVRVSVLHLCYGSESRNITIEKEKAANRALELLLEYCPGISTEPETEISEG
ncbi:MAG: hypothetical protein SPJ34_01670 [Candidatus Ornithospirochaeta sp.]|nr:hypothetical protein [Candidatus Ornithospirochaeta sp.]